MENGVVKVELYLIQLFRLLVGTMVRKIGVWLIVVQRSTEDFQYIFSLFDA